MKQKKKGTNRLIDEKSPYLLQHANHPVDWYPWGQEAFRKAKQEEKPIFLSIGYSTCHWCHVMAEESFADDEVAELLNRDYVAIKVDREERPDIDHLYMTVCQAMTGQGGWPLTIIMTPEKKPFYAGTYIPKDDRYGRTGLLKLLPRIAALWKEEKGRAEKMSDRVLEMVREYSKQDHRGEMDATVFDQAFETYARQFDETFGGFGAEPKFPRPHELLFLLRYGQKHGDCEAIKMVVKTLVMMRRGGIYDQIGFGFARYSVDREWLIPHFEKMLYDQAMLLLAYAEAYQVTRKPLFKTVVEEIFTYVDRELSHPQGGFYSAEDADSEGVEGKFYVWTPEEIEQVLGEEEGDLFCAAYDVTSQGNFEEGKSVCNQLRLSAPTFSREWGISEQELWQRLEAARQKLFAAREKRVHPHKDDKVLTAWNGLMIAALAYAGRALQEPRYIDRALKAARFVGHLQREDGSFPVRYRDGEAKGEGFLDDYAFLAWGMLELYEATLDSMWMKKAMKLVTYAREHFWDDQRGGFYFAAKGNTDLLVQVKEVYDGALPSGNAVIAYQLVRIAALTGDSRWQKWADEQLQALAGTVSETPTSHAFLLLAFQFALGKRQEIMIEGKRNEPEVQQVIDHLQQLYLPEAVIALRTEDEGEFLWTPSLDLDKPSTSTKPAWQVFVCEQYACRQPITELDELYRQFPINQSSAAQCQVKEIRK